MTASYQGNYEIRIQKYGIGHFERVRVTLSIIADQERDSDLTLRISPALARVHGVRIAELAHRGARLAQTVWSYKFQTPLPLCELTIDEIESNPALGSDEDARIAIALAILEAWSKLAGEHRLVPEARLLEFLGSIEVQVDIEGRTFLVL